jgi:hypothetical protein
VLRGELENRGNKNLIGKHQTVEMKISESHNERTDHQEDEQTDNKQILRLPHEQ